MIPFYVMHTHSGERDLTTESSTLLLRKGWGFLPHSVDCGLKLYPGMKQKGGGGGGYAFSVLINNVTRNLWLSL